MSALQAAKIIGADTRCATRNTSTESSFIKVVRIGDGNTPYLLKIVADSPSGTDPIDLLQLLFDQWKDSLRTRVDPFLSTILLDRDSLIANGTSQAIVTIIPRNNSDTLLASGGTILLTHTGAGSLDPPIDLGNGTYVSTLTAPLTVGTDTIRASVLSGTDTIQLAMHPSVVYFPTTEAVDGRQPPESFSLSQNFPNPFNPTTIIRYAVSSSSIVSLRVYSVEGKQVLVLVDGWRTAGNHAEVMNASTLSSGVYYYQLRTNQYVATRKMTIMR